MILIKVIGAKYLKLFKVELEFSNGSIGQIDLEKELWGEAFQPLLDQSYFAKFKLIHGTLTWPNGADFAPEFLYELAVNKNAITV
jgi:hypothetical protein